MNCWDGCGSQGWGKSEECLRFLAWETGRRAIVARAEVGLGESGGDAALDERRSIILDVLSLRWQLHSRRNFIWQVTVPWLLSHSPNSTFMQSIICLSSKLGMLQSNGNRWYLLYMPNTWSHLQLLYISIWEMVSLEADLRFDFGNW